MTPSQAIEMLTRGLERTPANLAPFAVLAGRLGCWPLMVELASRTLRRRVEMGDTLENALHYLERALDRRGAKAFDRADAEERNQAIGKSIEVSLALLSEDERKHYIELAAAPEDVEIPLKTAARLWGLDDFDAEELALRLHGLSLARFDLQTATLRLHDVMRGYVNGRLPAPARVHGKLVDAWGDPHHLPDDYAWRWYAYHLAQAGRQEQLRRLLLDFDWIRAKLEATDLTALIADYDLLPEEPQAKLVQGALRLSAHVVAQDKSQLAGQLLGRLLFDFSPAIRVLTERAALYHLGPSLKPKSCSLTPPGGPLLRTLEGHSGAVIAVAVTPDGTQALSASRDNTLKVWDLGSGRALRTLEGHSGAVRAVAVTPDGKQAVSASADHTLKIWDLVTGRALRTLEGHSDAVEAVAVTPDGNHVVSASDDKTLKVWDLGSGRVMRTLEGHNRGVNAVAVTPDEKQAVSASDDQTLKVWDLASGRAVRTLEGHSSGVSAVALTPDGKQAVSASYDKTLKVWDPGERACPADA